MWLTPVANAVCTSASAPVTFWPGRAYIKSMFTCSNKCKAVSMAASASPLLWIRPSFFRQASLKLCTPMDKRVMPASRKPSNFSRSKVPGLASSVISAAGCTRTSARTPASRRLMAAAENRLGVPPPIKMVSTGLPHTWGSSLAKSASKAST